MAQFARPSTDAVFTWQAGTPVNSAGNRWQNIDEAIASDTDYNYSANNPGTANEAEHLLTIINDPLSSTGHIVRYRYAKVNNGTLDGAGTAVDITINLRQGITLIAGQTHTNIPGLWTNGTFTLTAAQADSITNYSDLSLEFLIAGGGGNPGNRRGGAVSWSELEVPDVPITRRAQVSWAELEVPNAPRRSQVSWAEFEVPSIVGGPSLSPLRLLTGYGV